jgi:pyruvate dehydrogenase E2 component (dihydrolipoamide acetyltransferase)
VTHEVDIVVPQVGEAIAEATLVRWLKAEGDPVRRGDVLFEVDLDKSTVEVEAFDDGVLGPILVPDDSAVVPLQKVAVLLVEGPERAVPSVASSQSEGRTSASSSSADATAAAPVPDPVTPGPTGRSASPRARRRAGELGISLDDVVPTGDDGMINVADVERTAGLHARNGGDGRPLAGSPSREPLSRVRASVARRMAASKQTVPHFYVMADVDMTSVVELRRRAEGAGKVPTVTTILVAATAAALRSHPEFNASFVEGSLERRERVSIGVAVASEDGLRVPVIADADRLGLDELDVAVREAAERARQGRLRETDIGPRSLVVSNLGMHGVDAFVAIIDEPDPFILAAGRIRDAAVPVAGAVAVRPVATLSLSVDHRAFDGVDAARFLGAITTNLGDISRLAETPTGGTDE